MILGTFKNSKFLEISMNENKLDEIIKHLEDLDNRVSNIESNLSVSKIEIIKSEAPLQFQKEESFREFYIRHGPPKKETDKTLVIFHFLESRKKMDNITIKEIVQGFKEVKETVPKNISDKMQMLHRNGFVAPRDGLGRAKNWEITASGLKHLEGLKNE